MKIILKMENWKKKSRQNHKSKLNTFQLHFNSSKTHRPWRFITLLSQAWLSSVHFSCNFPVYRQIFQILLHLKADGHFKYLIKSI